MTMAVMIIACTAILAVLYLQGRQLSCQATAQSVAALKLQNADALWQKATDNDQLVMMLNGQVKDQDIIVTYDLDGNVTENGPVAMTLSFTQNEGQLAMMKVVIVYQNQELINTSINRLSEAKP
jgi:siroheme synthase